MALAKEDIEEIKELIVAVIAERRPEMAGNNVRYNWKSERESFAWKKS